MRLRWKWVIGLVWLSMMAWLLRYEVFPERFTHTLSGYRGLLSDGPLLMDNWMRIEFNEIHVGYSHTRVETVEDERPIQYRVENRTAMQLNILGTRQQVYVDSTADLDALYRLQKLRFEMDSQNYEMTMEALRQEGERFQARLTTPAGTREFSVEIPDDAIIYSPMLELSLSELQPGQGINIRLFEPISMQPQTVLVKALRKETLMHRGKSVETTVLESSLQGMKSLSWLDETGKTLRQETPMGWTLVETHPDDALSLSDTELSGDLLRSMAVPIRGKLDRPRTAQRISYRLHNLSIPPDQLQRTSSRQAVEIEEDGSLILRVTRQDGPGGQAQADMAPPGDEDLIATPYIQSDHPKLLAKARFVTLSETNRLEEIHALYRWVHRSVTKNPTVSLPSALDVLKTLEGDCNEHTYLFVGLARSLGIPARVQVGVVYNEGGFFYHAWPAVYDGSGWIEVDPTLGQERVDSTHIALVSGEIADQLQLLGVVGRMEVEVLCEAEELK